MTPTDKNVKVAEIAMVTIALMVCLNSAYSLFFESVMPPSPNEITEITGNRGPASANQANADYESLNIGCLLSEANNTQFQTSSERIRVLGTFCKKDLRKPAAIGDKIFDVKNINTKYSGELFRDQVKPHQFSTDFIPLQKGENKIVIQIRDNSETIEKILIINKN